MAEIFINDLIKILKENPGYASRWENEVSAEKALYIRFTQEKFTALNSKEYILKNGFELILDLDDQGVVCGIEIS